MLEDVAICVNSKKCPSSDNCHRQLPQKQAVSAYRTHFDGSIGMTETDQHCDMFIPKKESGGKN